MDEWVHYDKAVAQAIPSVKNLCSPLASWDIFISREVTLEFETHRNLLMEFAQAHDWQLTKTLTKLITPEHVIVVTDPEIRIVLATPDLYRMNGFRPEEVMGKSPKMFQGEATSRKVTRQIREAIDQRKPFTATLVNYFKDGVAYDCRIKGFPVYNTKGEFVHFIAFEKAA